MAVGGYGRRELCPGSDLDVLLLHKGRKDIARVAERIWYPIWDTRIPLDHSVRTPAEAQSVAEHDLNVVLGLLDGRVVAGDVELARPVLERVRERWRQRAAKLLPQLHEAVQQRHEQYDEVAFLLEPDLKEGRGGLRDVTALRDVALAVPVPALPVLEPAYEVLLTVRAELHRCTGRSSDVLRLQDQDAVATALGYPDADALMAAVAGAARTVAWSGQEMWRRVTSALAGPDLRTAGRDRPAGTGLVVRDGEVTLTAEADPAGDPTLPWRLGTVAAEVGVPIAPRALERLGAESPAPADPWPPSLRHAFVDLLAAGRPAIEVLEALDQVGLIVRLLPEWAAVRNRPQRNAYHRFTVDRHLCETAAGAAELTGRVSRPDLLLLGAWLHDLGKGFPGDHTEVGMTLVRDIGARMGLPAADVAVLVAMVEHHLLLPDAATRRDLDDPATVRAVADAVGSREVLDLLAALTVADSVATGPAAWGDWKAGLVEDLVQRTRAALAGSAPVEPEALAPAYADLAAAGELRVVAHDAQVVVAAPDRPGLFWRVAGTLALHGLDVRSASASLADGMAVDVFDVELTEGRAVDVDRLRADVEKALSGRLSIEARLSERARAYAGLRRPQAARPVEPRVTVDNEASATASVVEVRAPDAVGVLYRIARALADCDLDVRRARITTLGPEVVDTFYVVDAQGRRIEDAEHIDEIRRAVLGELAHGG